MTLESVALGNIVQILLLIVTAVGAALIVKQLREERRASQMEGLMQLNQQHQEIDEAMFEIRKIIKPSEWASLTAEEQVKKLTANDPMILTWRKIAGFHEMLGLLVKSKSFDREIAYQYYSSYTIAWYRNLKPVIEDLRSRAGADIFEHFEWLAAEFEKMKH